jgi:hypothetical protein
MQKATPVFHLHPSKTAGSTIIATVAQFFAPRLRDIYEQGVACHLLPEQERTSDHMSISVRNPYQRFTSISRFYPLKLVLSKDIDVATFLFYNFKRFQGTRTSLNFDYYDDREQFGLWARQSDWFNLATGEVSVIRFESLADDINTVYGISELTKHLQNLGKNQYDLMEWKTAFPSQRRLDQFNHIFESDFELFNYDRIEHLDDLFHYFVPNSE